MLQTIAEQHLQVGRPTVLTEQALDKLREAFLMGSTDEEACQFAEISDDALYKYQRENPEFINQKKRWKTSPILKARKTIIDNLDKVSVAEWYLERKAKNEFSLKTETGIEMNGELKFITVTDLLRASEQIAESQPIS